MNTDNLAATMIRLFLAHLVLCRDDFEAADVRFWASLLGDEEGATDMCREVMAYRQAMRRLRDSRSGNPRNVAAVVIYNASHSGPRSPEVQARWEARLAEGFNWESVARLDQAMQMLADLQGAYLSERQIGLLAGRVVNLDRVTQLIVEEYQKLGEEGCHGG